MHCKSGWQPSLRRSIRRLIRCHSLPTTPWPSLSTQTPCPPLPTTPWPSSPTPADTWRSPHDTDQSFEEATSAHKRALAEIAAQIRGGDAHTSDESHSGSAVHAPSPAVPAPTPSTGFGSIAMLASKKMNLGATLKTAAVKGLPASQAKGPPKPLEAMDATKGVCSKGVASSAASAAAVPPPGSNVGAASGALAVAPPPPTAAAAPAHWLDHPSGWHGQLPLPKSLVPASPIPPGSPPSSLFDALLRGHVADMDRAREAAQRIREPSYTLKMFHDDCLRAFPELQLYVVGPLPQPSTSRPGATRPLKAADPIPAATSSGFTATDEYLRTIGALFAIYWMMRIGIDGYAPRGLQPHPSTLCSTRTPTPPFHPMLHADSSPSAPP